VAAACARLGCDLVLLLGDNLYPTGMDTPADPRMDGWIRDVYAPLGLPVYLVLGNHDYGTGRDLQRAEWQVAWARGRPGFHLPARAWVSDIGPARFIGLDTNAAFQFGDLGQGAFLEEQLSTSAALWNVVFGHHPLRSDGPHGNAGAYDGAPWVPLVAGESVRQLLEPAVCARADLYLSGHDHSRQLIDYCGAHLVVSGAGASTTPLGDHGNQRRFGSEAPGAVWISLGPDRGQIVFLGADGAGEADFELTPRVR
jgi:tartrate-resistant acid phosphatase type 5